MKPVAFSLPCRRLLRRSPAAFTLIELMVVISIIGILAGITIPAAIKIVANAKKKVALNDANQLTMAITSFFTEYRKYPTRNLEPDHGDKPTLSDHGLMDILIPSDKEAGPGGLNPRRHGALSYRNARPMRDDRYRGGIVLQSDGSGTLWDPYGNHYRVVMDTDYNQRIPAPSFDSGTEAIMQSVIAWSAGADGDDTTVEDNIMTWRP